MKSTSRPEGVRQSERLPPHPERLIQARISFRIAVSSKDPRSAEFKNPWSDGSTHVVFTPPVFLERLAAPSHQGECGARRELIALITDPTVVVAILDSLACPASHLPCIPPDHHRHRPRPTSVINHQARLTRQ